MSKITQDSFNSDLRKRLGAVLQSGFDFYTSAERPNRYEYGYGTSLLQTQAVTAASKVDDPEWDNIRLDIIKTRSHQKGALWVTDNLTLQDDTTTVNNIFDVNSIDDPRYAPDKIKLQVYNYYKGIIDNLETDRFLADPSELDVVSPDESQTFNLNFSTSATWTYSATFANAATCCQFFNAGGSFKFLFESQSLDLAGPQGRQSRNMRDMINFASTNFDLRVNASVFYANHRTTVTTTTPPVFTVNSTDGNYANVNNVKFFVFTNNAQLGSASRVSARIVLTSGYSGGQPSGSGAGAVGYGDFVKISVEPSVDISRSNGIVVSSIPTTTSYGSFSAG